ncbi:MAG TPA: hypothetical protein VGC66_02825 [Pyrinomonadaceae bacterium]
MHLRFMLALLLCLMLVTLTSALRQPVLAQTRQAGSGIAYANARVRRTRIMYPRLTRYRDAKVMREVNRQIDTATKDFNCEGQGGKGSYFTVRSKVAYADNDIFSIYASASYYCNTAYPTNDANLSQTFDLKTGKLVAFEELFKNYEADRAEIMKIIFAREIARSEKLAASGKPKEQSCEGDPDMYSLEHLEGSTYSFNFSRTGLQVQPQWAHVIEACANIVTVPYSKLQKFAAPGGLLSRVTK